MTNGAGARTWALIVFQLGMMSAGCNRSNLYSKDYASAASADDPCPLGSSCDAGGSSPLQCPYSGPPVIDPSSLPTCSPTCAGAHCLPSQDVPASWQNPFGLTACAGGFCMPDPMIESGGNYVPPTCTAFTGTGAEGRCLSICLPAIQAQGTLHQQSCGADERCAPCYDPLTGRDTGACHTATCDQPQNPPYRFPTCCPFNGTDEGTCIPTEILSISASGLNQLSCPDGLLCVPSEYLPDASTGRACTGRIYGSLFWGTCTSNCVNLGAYDDLFPQGSCAGNHRCVPCSLAPVGSRGC
jgi:hypothetical protein